MGDQRYTSEAEGRSEALVRTVNVLINLPLPGVPLRKGAGRERSAAANGQEGGLKWEWL